jgi:hypothetical protein
MKFERLNYLGWPTCYRLDNGEVELIVTGDVGPRLIHFGFAGKENLFAVLPGTAGLTGGEDWRVYGGHRLWHAPEAMPRTYYGDNHPVKVEFDGVVLRIAQPVEPWTGIQKKMEIRMAKTGARILVRHILVNQSMWPVELAPWALTVMAPGGTAIAPLPPRGSHPEHLLPSGTIALWPYTNMADPRWTWGERFVMLRQDAGRPLPQKIGFNAPDGWAAYVRNDTLFVKRFEVQPGADYLDFGSCLELFTDDSMLEVETLGPARTLAPGQSAIHDETWYLAAHVSQPFSDEDVERDILPLFAGFHPDGKASDFTTGV